MFFVEGELAHLIYMLVWLFLPYGLVFSAVKLVNAIIDEESYMPWALLTGFCLSTLGVALLVLLI